MSKTFVMTEVFKDTLQMFIQQEDNHKRFCFTGHCVHYVIYLLLNEFDQNYILMLTDQIKTVINLSMKHSLFLITHT